MTTQTTRRDSPRPAPKLGVRVWLQVILAMAVVPLLALAAAGNWRWVWGWVLVAYYILSFAISRGLVALKHPDLIAERGTYAKKDDALPVDRGVVTAGALILPLIAVVVAGLDERFGWSPEVVLWLHLTGVGLVTAGAALGTWAMLANRFFSAVVRIQTERGHVVVEDGPYRFVRHPGYLGSVLSYIGLPLMLGSLWAYLVAVLVMGLTVYRLTYEDRFLYENLPGYADYTRRTRFRLIPGVW